MQKRCKEIFWIWSFKCSVPPVDWTSSLYRHNTSLMCMDIWLYILSLTNLQPSIEGLQSWDWATHHINFELSSPPPIKDTLPLTKDKTIPTMTLSKRRDNVVQNAITTVREVFVTVQHVLHAGATNKKSTKTKSETLLSSTPADYKSPTDLSSPIL